MAKIKERRMNRIFFEIVMQVFALWLVYFYVGLYIPQYNPDFLESLLVLFVITIFRIVDFLGTRYFDKLDKKDIDGGYGIN